MEDLDNGYRVNRKGDKIPLSEETTKRISEEASKLQFYISGGKKKK